MSNEIVSGISQNKLRTFMFNLSKLVQELTILNITAHNIHLKYLFSSMNTRTQYSLMLMHDINTFLHAIDEVIHQPSSLLNRHGEAFLHGFFYDIRIRECSAKPCASEFLLLTDWHPMDVTVRSLPFRMPHRFKSRASHAW